MDYIYPDSDFEVQGLGFSIREVQGAGIRLVRVIIWVRARTQEQSIFGVLLRAISSHITINIIQLLLSAGSTQVIIIILKVASFGTSGSQRWGSLGG